MSSKHNDSIKDSAKAFAKSATTSLLNRLRPDPDKGKPANPSSSATPVYADLVQGFESLAISGKPSVPSEYSRTTGFVGGFKPGYPPPTGPYAHYPVPFQPTPDAPPVPPKPNQGSSSSPGSLPSPPPMPMPVHGNELMQSLTMQYALQPPVSVPAASSRPHSTSVLSSFSQAVSASPALTSTESSSSRPTKPSRPRASSDPPTSISAVSSTGNTVQCSGMTKAGARCSRQVKIGPMLFDVDETVIRYCHQHTKEILTPTEFSARKGGVVKFADWIPEHLSAVTQAALRTEMATPISDHDKPGYIYTFEIRDLSSPKTIKLKVGRTTNLAQRIDQWGKQCQSKEQVLRGYYPDFGDAENGGSLLKGRLKPGPPGPYCHRLEKLIHLELADLVYWGVYLDSAWPNVEAPAAGNGNGDGTPKKRPRVARLCPDCGTLHKEIFEFKRIEKGRYKGKEWDNIVKPIIEKWGAFVEVHC